MYIYNYKCIYIYMYTYIYIDFLHIDNFFYTCKVCEYSGLDRFMAPCDHQSTSETHPAGLHEIGGEESKRELQ